MRTLAAAALALLAAGAAPARAVDLLGAGATFPAPLYLAWIEDYQADHPDVHIGYDPVGSGEGVARFMTGEVDFGASDAAMTDRQMARVEDGVVLVPATAGMVVVAFNLPRHDGELRLGREALLGIFSGAIEAWDDPRIAADNPGQDLPHRTISIVTRRDASGTTFAFTHHLSAIGPAWREDGPGVGLLVDWPGGAMTAYGNDGVAGRIRISQYSIGYVEHGFAERLDLPVAALQNRAGRYVRPTAEAGAAALEATVDRMPPDGRLFLPDPPGANSYPIVTYSWLLLRGRYAETGVSEALRAFIGWGVTEGQRHAARLGYIPLPPSVAERSQALIDTVE